MLIFIFSEFAISKTYYCATNGPSYVNSCTKEKPCSIKYIADQISRDEEIIFVSPTIDTEEIEVLFNNIIVKDSRLSIVGNGLTFDLNLAKIPGKIELKRPICFTNCTIIGAMPTFVCTYIAFIDSSILNDSSLI